jgi:alkylation response protein AidB-like acyl-CoA dehydrogenase
MIGPSILRYGTEEQKAQFLPPIAAGELQIAMGYTEPNAGSDLASLEMRAERDGDDFVITGEKVFNSACHFAGYHWLSARTDPSVPKRHGISMFMVPLDSEGIDIQPIFTIPGGRTNAAHYDHVRLPASALVGELNQGWELITHAFSAERIYVVPIMELSSYFAALLPIAQRGRLLEPGLRVALANMAIELEVAKLYNYRALSDLTNARDARVSASIAKVFQTELAQRLANLALAILGPYGQLGDGEQMSPCDGDFTLGFLACPMPTFGGGSSEVLRDLIATWGLGLPRYRD